MDGRRVGTGADAGESVGESAGKGKARTKGGAGAFECRRGRGRGRGGGGGSARCGRQDGAWMQTRMRAQVRARRGRGAGGASERSLREGAGAGERAGMGAGEAAGKGAGAGAGVGKGNGEDEGEGVRRCDGRREGKGHGTRQGGRENGLTLRRGRTLGPRRGCKAEGGREPRRDNWGTRTDWNGRGATHARRRAVRRHAYWVRGVRAGRVACVPGGRGVAWVMPPRACGRGGEISASHPVEVSAGTTAVNFRAIIHNHAQSRM